MRISHGEGGGRSQAAVRLSAAAALVLLIALAQPREARAQWTNTSPHISNTNSGNVGVGTSAPAKRLDVNGSIFAGNSISLGKGVTDYAGVGFNRDVDTGTILDPARGAYQIHNATGKLFFTTYSGAGTFLGHTLTFDGTNVGVGNMNPGAYKLNVSGPILGWATYSSYTGDGLYSATATPSRIQTNSGGSIIFGYEDWGYGDYSPRVGFQQSYDPVGSPYLTTTKASIGLIRDGSITVKGGANHAEYMRVTAAGNVGVGTDVPGAKLDVNGVIRSSAARGFSVGNDLGRQRIEIHDTSPTFFFLTPTNGAAPVNVGGLAITDIFPKTAPANGLYVQGNVGIGTTNPSRKLVVSDSAPSTLVSVDNSAGALVKTFVQSNSAAFGAFGTETNHPLHLTTNNESKLTILADGKVGIGTTNPQQTLDVNGSVNVVGAITGGSIQARYQDVAEWVPSVERLAPGTVVVLDPARANHVLASSASYDTAVAGVVSARPGLVLGEGGEGRVMVATTGRVRVRVDAARGAIRIGDLLVTSDVAGVAMRSEPVAVGGRRLHAPGTIIGKALEPLASGAGEILVLLSMQ